MKKYIEFFAKDKLLVNLIFISVFIIGLVLTFNIRRETFPPTDIDKMIITVAYPGASPADVELNAVIPVEEELSEITGIDQYTSVSIEGGAQIIVELDQDLDDKQSVKDEVFRDITLSNLTDVSDDVEDIVVMDLNSGLKSILKIGISIKEGGGATEKDLYRAADILDAQLKRIDGVSETDMHGYLDREIHVKVDSNKMNDLYISLADVVSSIQNRNIRSSGGTMQSVYNEKSIVTMGQFENPMDVGDVIIRSGFEQRRVKVKDIANVEDGFEDQDVVINVNGEKSVVIDIKKKENADIIKTVDRIKKYLEDNPNPKFDLSVVADDSKSVKSLIDVVINNALIGFVLVFLVLLIFLDLRTSFWTAVSIPFCMFLVIIFMRFNNYSLNIMTLGAIITVLGMMVDDAIVIAEVIYEKKRQGISPIMAAVEGTREVFSPVLVSILTTIFAFLPILMIKGTMGKFIFVFPVVIAVTLLFSLFEAVTILPNHLAQGKAKEKVSTDHWFGPFMRFYKKVLGRALKLRYGVLALFVVLLIGSVNFAGDSIRGFVLFWDNSNEYVDIDLDFPAGTSIEKTELLTKKLEKAVIKFIPEDELVSTFSQAGTHSGHSMNHDYWSTIQLKFVPINDRDRTAGMIVNDLREKIKENKLKGYSAIVVREQKAGPPTGDPVDIKVISSDVKEAGAVMKTLQAMLSKIDGVKDIDSDKKDGKAELKFKFNYDKMAQYGMDVQTIASTVRTAYEGSEATYIQTLDEKLDFVVELQDRFKGSEAALMNLLIPNDSGRLIRLKEIASLQAGTSDSEINHFNGYRTISVTADVDTELTTPMKVQKTVKEEYAKISSKFGNTYLLFEGEAKESAETMSDLTTSFMIALFLIYIIVVLLFRSFSQPFVVMSVIPFGLIGVLVAFQLHGIPLSFMAIIGVIGLSGVVVNDSIIMVEFINKLKKKGAATKAELFDNISEGATQRLRPIIMTTVTTVAALLPTVYGIGGNALTLVPTVMAMAYGLLFATVLTLVFVPCLYMINEDISGLVRRIGDKLKMIIRIPDRLTAGR